MIIFHARIRRKKKKMEKSQNDEILKHLQTHRGITAAESFSIYGITRLSARIWDLRERGFHIVNCERESVDRRGKKVKFVEYRLVKSAN